MKRTLFAVLAVAVMAILGWFGYQYQRGGLKPVEIAGSQRPAAVSDSPSQGTMPARQGAGTAAAGPGGAGSAGGAGVAGVPAGAGGAAVGGGAARGPIGVEVAKVEKLDLVEDVTAVGNMRANETVMIKPEIAGRIDRIGFTDGARVARGAVLVHLDSSVTAAEVDQARAELALSQSSYQRTVELAQKNFVSSSALDQASANLKIQQAKLKLSEARLSKSLIKAPFAGVLGLRNVSLGDFVKDGADLVLLEDVSTMKVDLRLPERFLGQLGRGQAVQIAVDAFPGKTFKATINAIDAQVDANGRSVTARGVLENPEGVLRSGMFAKARIILKTKADAIVVPEEALVPVGSDIFVYRLEGKKAMRIKVTTGLRRDAKVEVFGPIAVGDLVVTAGQIKLPRDAMEVRVIEPGRRPGSGAPGGPPGPGGSGGPGAPGGPSGPAGAALDVTKPTDTAHSAASSKAGG